MKTRFNSLAQSPDANEGTLMNSNYSMERSPKTALLFEAKRNVVLPLVGPDKQLHTAQAVSQAKRKVECSEQEH